MNAPDRDPTLAKELDVLPYMRAIARTWHERLNPQIDPMGMLVPLVHAQLAWILHPSELIQHMEQFNQDVFAVAAHAQRRMLGLPSEEPVDSNPDDMRFVDPVWTEHATWDICKDWYLLVTRRTLDMLYATPGMSEKERGRAAFWTRQWLNVLAPTNFFWTNPLAMRQAVETHGDSLTRGWRNFLDDLSAGDIRMTDPSDFKVGGNLATTPGAVVARNRLMEVIHYKPTQAKVHTTPIVIITAWINKYYVLDLVPKKSMVRFLLDQGFDVFITSWKNPDASMTDVTFDEYLTSGVDTIINIARDISGAKQVHAVGYCLGGTALTSYMAWASRAYPKDKQPVAHWTLLASLVDFSEPGEIEVFIDEKSINYLIESMREKGYLEGKQMAMSFRLLRSNPLIWHYYVNSYLCGEKPPPFDALYWNTDLTRMPATMHSWYLRELYLHNRLVKPDALTLAGQPIDIERIDQPVYAVGGEDDHIAPWESTFRVTNFVRGPKRYVLSSSGHIFGIVNPPVDPPKRRFCADTVHRTDTPASWQARSPWTAGSWWDDWITWLRPQMGPQAKAPALSNKNYPIVCDAPGTYVLET